MKKVILSLSLLVAGYTVTQAQVTPTRTIPTLGTPGNDGLSAPPPITKPEPENMHFKTPVHDFGIIQEGPTADHEFEFTNVGKEPIIISNVSASCGCTTPSYSKDPVLPGKKGTIKASYNTQGRVAPFTKTITITSNIGVKVLTIKGEVEKAPEGSVPQSNSMIKTH
ncbi:MAG TPA: DUF1573 domain-containing protein [Chitinophagaceae bacterium]|nr:DUF1573 domain-containing protein [Chitinophagaceae bacterium]